MPPRPALRAALLALVITLEGISSIPVSERLTAEDLAKEGAQAEIDVWMRLLGPVLSRETFEALVVTGSDVLMDLRGAAMFFLRPVHEQLKVGQGWALFANPQPKGNELQIVGLREGEDEVLLYRKFDPEHALLADQLRWRRLRGIWDNQSGGPSIPFKNMGQWIADHAFASDPTLTAVEVRIVTTETPPRGEVRTTPPEIKMKRRYPREAP